MGGLSEAVVAGVETDIFCFINPVALPHLAKSSTNGTSSNHLALSFYQAVSTQFRESSPSLSLHLTKAV